jgi:HNH endonuclease/AP2 domain
MSENPSIAIDGYCECGCGEKTGLADRDRPKQRWRAGKPKLYIKGHTHRGSRHPQWKGGRSMQGGYVVVYDPSHPRANVDGYVPEHISLATKALGRPLPNGVEVHHFDRNRRNNSPYNLVVCPDKDYHMLLHVRQRADDACGNPDWRKCTLCKQYDVKANLNRIKKDRNTREYYHASCSRERHHRRKAPLTREKVSVYKGVSFEARTNKWYARIHIDGKTISLGYFTTELAAAKAHQRAKENFDKAKRGAS